MKVFICYYVFSLVKNVICQFFRVGVGEEDFFCDGFVNVVESENVVVFVFRGRDGVNNVLIGVVGR